MNPDWQTWAAVAVVIITAILFVVRSKRKKTGGCASCNGGSTPRVKP